MENKLLNLPIEVRLQIWTYLITPTYPLVMRSLFLRSNYRNIFMTQQIKQLCISLLPVCRQITSEVLPILYAAPIWRAACRLEALASQIGVKNFALIRKLGVDADDLGNLIESLVLDAKDATFPNTANKQSNSMVVLPEPRRLRFAKLEVLEVEGYQSVALTSKGSQKSRKEALTLCSFAKQILSYHPILNVLVQTGGDMGRSDALDLSMGRVKWRFLRETGTECPRMAANEHKVDLDALHDMLNGIVELDQQDVDNKLREKEALAGWTDEGFRQYPYLTSLHNQQA